MKFKLGQIVKIESTLGIIKAREQVYPSIPKIESEKYNLYTIEFEDDGDTWTEEYREESIKELTTLEVCEFKSKHSLN